MRVRPRDVRKIESGPTCFGLFERRNCMQTQLQVVILISLVIFGSANWKYTPPPEPAPEIVVGVDGSREKLEQRQEALVRESLAYALYKVARIPEDRARVIVGLVLQETQQHTDLDPLLVLGLIVAESLANPQAKSRVGARGLMQIMPATGRFIAHHLNEEWAGTQSLYEMERNVRYGVWYLNHLQELFPEDEQAMIAAYNWGPDHIQYRQIQERKLPTVYPGKVWEAQQRLQEEMYAFHKTHFWRSLDLDQDPPSFRDDSSKPKAGSRPRELLVDDAEGQLLRQR